MGVKGSNDINLNTRTHSPRISTLSRERLISTHSRSFHMLSLYSTEKVTQS